MTTTIFSIVSSVLLRPLPVRSPAQVVEIFQTERDFPRDLVSMQDFLDWKRSLQSFAQLSLFRPGRANLTGSGRPELVNTLECDASMLPLLGFAPVRGRNFSPDENLPGRDQTALLSWNFWQNRLGGSDVLGRKILLGGKPYIVAGVLPRGLRLPADAAIWIPLSFDLSQIENTRGYHYYHALGRLKNGQSLGAANSELREASAVLSAEHPKEERGVSAQAVPFQDVIAGKVRTPLLLLFGAVTTLLLIACVNVAHLLLVKASLRTRELSIRMAIGATRTRIFTQLMTESVLLSAISGIAGVGLAAAAVRAFSRLERTPIPQPDELSVDWRVLVFALLLAGATGVFFGCFPVFHAWRAGINSNLKQSSGRISQSRAQQSMQKIFVFAQVTLATLLLNSSLLFVRSFANLADVDTGFHANQVLMMYLTLSGLKFGDSQAVGRVADQMRTRVKELPGVRSVAFGQDAPLLAPAGGEPLLIEGETSVEQAQSGVPVLPVPVSQDYFQTLGIPSIRGRSFDERDNRPEVSTAIVNESLVKQYFHGKDPLYKRVAFLTQPLAWKEIVGVVGDVRQTGLETAVGPQIYLPLGHLPLARLPIVRLCLLAKAKEQPMTLVPAIEHEIHDVEPDAPVVWVRTMRDLMAQQLGWRAIQTSFLTVFSGLALLFTSLGIYAVIAYSVSQRISEIGTRMAVGATETDILRMILIQGVSPAAAGALLGLACAAVSGTLISSLLFGIRAIDWPTYAAVLAIQVLVSVIATYVPARRAANVDPWRAVRYE